MSQAAVFVSARLQRAVAGLLALVAAQLILAACQPEPVAGFGAARVALAIR